MTRRKGTYKPTKNAKILDRAWELVQSVRYSVSERWVFYRLLQEGYYSKKSDIGNLDYALSRARHAFYKGWRPDTLADETREPVIRGYGFKGAKDWLEYLATQKCQLDRWDTQPYCVELWYEARAMTQQFLYYTEHITLRPMGGHASIVYKWRAAKALEQIAQVYQKPIIVLYFGDLDTAGETIADVIEEDVRKWCDVDFTFIRCGLTLEQVSQYNVPENPEKPGQYQWEALTDDAAREIITSHVNQFVRHDGFSEIEAREATINTWVRDELIKVAEKSNGR